MPPESTITPSITQSGSLFPREVIPLTLTVDEDPGAPELAAIKTPETLPCKDCSILVIGKSYKSFALTLEIDPVTTLFF